MASEQWVEELKARIERVKNLDKEKLIAPPACGEVNFEGDLECRCRQP